MTEMTLQRLGKLSVISSSLCLGEKNACHKNIAIPQLSSHLGVNQLSSGVWCGAKKKKKKRRLEACIKNWMFNLVIKTKVDE